jgi:LmbE family N-acetylglucosaminyl deacetylase
MKNLVFAVHPDDETLGAGATLLKCKEQGDKNYWCIFTQMGKNFPEKVRKIREKELKLVEKTYAFEKSYQLGFETTKLDLVPRGALIAEIAKVINEVKPDRIFVPFKFDSHSDHKIAYEALSTFFKCFRYPFVKEIWAMETISETDFSSLDGRENFVPNTYVDVSKHFKKKLEIMKIYASELGEHPFPRSLKSIEALALYRGAQSYVKFAESFMLIKQVL